MSNESSKGCPRCDDYDKIKDELEQTKRRSQEDQKSALKRCEDSKSQLQKKLLTVGAAAVVGATIVGKDFVDTIYEYLNSFNKVKNAASGLVSMADTPADVPTTEIKEEQKEEPTEDKRDPVDTTPRLAKAFPVIPLTDWSLDVPYLMGDPYRSPLEDILFAENTSATASFLDGTEDLSMLMDAFQIDQALSWDVPPLLFPDLPVYYDMGLPVQNAAIVPESGAWISLMMIPMVWHPRRRRR